MLALTYIYTRGRAGAPVAVVACLAGLSAIRMSYLRCYDRTHPFFFTVIWTAKLMRGDVGNGDECLARASADTPIAVYVAQLTATDRGRPVVGRAWRRCSCGHSSTASGSAVPVRSPPSSGSTTTAPRW